MPGKFALYTYHFQQIGINATKIEKTGIHFKTDVFAAVAVVDAKAPYFDSDGNGNVKKQKVRLEKQQLCTYITLFCIFLLPPLLDYDVK